MNLSDQPERNKIPKYLRHKESLEAAFDFFNETSAQLSSSYSMLEKKVKTLTSELNTVAAEKDAEHTEKHKIETRMKALLDFLPGGVIVLDARGQIIESNPAARDLLKSELTGLLWRDVITESFAPKNDDGLEVSTRSGKRISLATSSMDNQGQLILLTDQTETRKLQQNLSRHEKLSAMGKMVSALAHQIRTPLSAAMLYAGHLCNSDLDENKRKEFSKKIHGRLHHMEKQVRDMMLFVKNELPLNDQVTIADLEIGLREASEVSFLTSGSRCEWDNKASNTVIKCQREALISALMNLVNNALQSRVNQNKSVKSNNVQDDELSSSVKRVSDEQKTYSQTHLRIRFFNTQHNHSECVGISVRDNGPGMSKNELAKCQELFFTNKAQGTGLGLAVVQSVARAHGAQFKLFSEVGKGTEAIFILPAVTGLE